MVFHRLAVLVPPELRLLAVPLGGGVALQPRLDRGLTRCHDLMEGGHDLLVHGGDLILAHLKAALLQHLRVDLMPSQLGEQLKALLVEALVVPSPQAGDKLIPHGGRQLLQGIDALQGLGHRTLGKHLVARIIGVELGKLTLGDGHRLAGLLAGMPHRLLFRRIGRLCFRAAIRISYLGRSILVEMVVNGLYSAIILLASLRRSDSVASGLTLMYSTILSVSSRRSHIASAM